MRDTEDDLSRKKGEKVREKRIVRAERKQTLTKILCNLGIQHLELFDSLFYGFLILQILLFFFG